MPIIRRSRPCITAYGVHTAYDPAPHNHSQHNQCRTPYAVIHGLDLLMMGIMMPETCWDRGLIINIGLVEWCWFISVHPTFHDARSQEPKTSPGLSVCPHVETWELLKLCSWNLMMRSFNAICGHFTALNRVVGNNGVIPKLQNKIRQFHDCLKDYWVFSMEFIWVS